MPTAREILAAQDSVIGRDQALAAGVSRHRWQWAIKSGRAQQVLWGVAVGHSGEPSLNQLLWACCLYGGEQAHLGGDAALVARGFDLGELKRIDLVVPHQRQVRSTALPDKRKVAVHRVRGLDRFVASTLGPPRVSAHVAVLQAAAWAESDRAAEWRVAAAVQRRITAVPLLRQALKDLPQLNRRALVRKVLDEVELGAHALSELEFLRFLRKHGLPLPDRLQVKVRAGGTRYLDARYDRLRRTFEIDGAHHMLIENWEADALRSLELVAALEGETLLRLTPGMMRNEEARLVPLLRKLLA